MASRVYAPVMALLLLLAGADVRAAERGSALETRTLVVGASAEPRSLNPVAVTTTEGHQVTGLVFQKLMQEQDDFVTFKPQLAESWNISDDGLDVTFRLRDDARWEDDRPVTAEDVRFTWEVQVDTTVAWPNATIKSRIRDVEVRDARTVVFHFTERYLYALMDANDGVILPRHLLGDIPRKDLKSAAFGRAPVGNGPYRVSRWESGQYIELVPNPAWYGSAPRVERVLFKFIPDAVTAVAQMRAGEIDLLESVKGGDIAALRRERPDVKWYDVPSRRINLVAWNLRRAPFDDRRLRRALAQAVNRAEIIRAAWGEHAREANSPFVPLTWAWDASQKPIRHDPASARAELAACGFKDSDGDGTLDRAGKPLSFELLVSDAQHRVDVATLVQAQLKAVGVKVELRVMEFGATNQRVLAGDYDAAVLDWSVPTKADLTPTFHSRSIGNKQYNFAGYSNPEVDRLIDEALLQTDQKAAGKIWRRAQRIVYDDQPWMFIAYPQVVTAVDDRFCNVTPSPISFLVRLPYWGVSPDCKP